MGDTTAPQHEPTAPTEDEAPPAVPIIQALGIIATVAAMAIDAWGPPDFSPPWQIYLLFGAAIISLGPEQAIRLLQAWRGK